MQTIKGNYINSLNAELIFKKGDKHFTIVNEEIHELVNIVPDTFKYIVFIPGSRLIETIESADADKTIVIDKEIKYFEKEKDVTYFININKIVLLEKLKENTVSIVTNSENYLFEILPENINKLEGRLLY